MTAGELLIAARERLDVVADSSFWTDKELITYANAARDRLFLIVRKLIIDSTTANDATALPLCRISLVAGTATYALSKKILGITRLKLASQSVPLGDPIPAAELDASYGSWETLPTGEPWAYCVDLNSDSITFVPAPIANDTASLTVYRMPLARLTTDDLEAELGFREEYHEDLIPWILHLAFSKQDSEVYNPGLAEEYRRKFLDRAAEIKLEMHRHVVAPHGNKMRRAFGAR